VVQQELVKIPQNVGSKEILLLHSLVFVVALGEPATCTVTTVLFFFIYFKFYGGEGKGMGGEYLLCGDQKTIVNFTEGFFSGIKIYKKVAII